MRPQAERSPELRAVPFQTSCAVRPLPSSLLSMEMSKRIVMSAFGADHRMTYSPYVRPGCTLKGDKTVLVDARLYDVEPLAYKFMVNFANDNNLQIEWMGDTPL